MTTRLKLNTSKTLPKNKKMNPTIVKMRLGALLRSGLDIDAAAKSLGITKYQLGLLRSDPEFEDFVEENMAKCESCNVSNITNAGSVGQWQASAWMLERRFPDKYGKKDTVKHEYEIKLLSFQKVILNIINRLDPHIRHTIMKELRRVKGDQEMIEFNKGTSSNFEDGDLPIEADIDL